MFMAIVLGIATGICGFTGIMGFVCYILGSLVRRSNPILVPVSASRSTAAPALTFSGAAARPGVWLGGCSAATFVGAGGRGRFLQRFARAVPRRLPRAAVPASGAFCATHRDHSDRSPRELLRQMVSVGLMAKIGFDRERCESAIA